VGLPTQGRERQALDLLNESRGYLERLAQDRQIERFDIAVLKPQTTELQLVADPVGIVDVWCAAWTTPVVTACAVAAAVLIAHEVIPVAVPTTVCAPFMPP
jgi:hypothetical protein